MDTLKTLFLAILLLLCSCKEKQEGQHGVEEEKASILEETNFVHEDGTICHAQSPINILSFSQDSAVTHNITLNFRDEVNAVENLGHTVQLDMRTGSNITVDDETFDFKQAHFHTPSEHLVDGVVYPMEMHMVNTLKGQKEGEETEFLVVGVLFKMGKESKFINEFINTIPKEEHKVSEVTTGTVRFSDLWSEQSEAVLDHYYHYKGSLTTPPYSETVRWYVSKTIFQASPEQIKTMLNFEGVNARQIQALNNRTLESE